MFKNHISLRFVVVVVVIVGGRSRSLILCDWRFIFLLFKFANERRPNVNTNKDVDADENCNVQRFRTTKSNEEFAEHYFLLSLDYTNRKINFISVYLFQNIGKMRNFAKVSFLFFELFSFIKRVSLIRQVKNNV